MRKAPERKQDFGAAKPTNKTSQPELMIAFSQPSLPPNEFSVASRVIPERNGKRVIAHPQYEIMILLAPVRLSPIGNRRNSGRWDVSL